MEQVAAYISRAVAGCAITYLGLGIAVVTSIFHVVQRVGVVEAGRGVCCCLCMCFGGIPEGWSMGLWERHDGHLTFRYLLCLRDMAVEVGCGRLGSVSFPRVCFLFSQAGTAVGFGGFLSQIYGCLRWRDAVV